jgi:hypothetical protein
VRDDDTFELGGIIGKVLFRANPPAPWRVKAVTVDERDITHVGVDAASLGGDRRVHVVLSDRMTNLSGSVRDGRGQPVSDYVLVLLPQQPMEGMGATSFTRMVRPDQHGSFNLRALPPGEYVAGAVGQLEVGGEWNPEVQEKVRAAGRPFVLADGQTLRLDLELLP